MGLLTLAVGFGGRLALLGATVHLLAHAVSKAMAFLAAGDVVQQFGTRRLGRIRGVLAASPDSGPGLVLSTLVVGGLPPSAVFAAEVAIVVGGVETGWIFPAAVAAVLLALAFAALASHAVRLAWGTPRRRVAVQRRSAAQAGVMFVPLGALVILGVWTPEPVRQAIDSIILVLRGASV
jgi:hydrogenase-4 component F